MPSANLNGTSLSYEEKGAGPALVLVHGFPLDARVWSAQVSELSSRCRVITPDLRGFGKSTAAGPFTMESAADDLHALLAHVKALPCVLGGLSMGGYIALAYIKKYPTDLRGLALIDTKAEADTPQGKEGRQKMIELARAKGSEAVGEQMMPKMLGPDTVEHRPQVARELRAIMNACPPKTIEYALAAMRDRADHTCNLPSISVPTLIIVGDADAITPPSVAESMNQQIPRSQLSVVRGAGHMAIMEQPAQVNQALRQFMDSLPMN
jgi:pimeloyl-ACP methyl ester carboxylesterase